MSRSFRCASAVLLLALSMLAACGGGGGGGGDDIAEAEAAAPPPPTNDRTACFPDMATYDGLALRTKPEEAIKRIGCPPFEPAPNASNPQDKTYRWTELQNGLQRGRRSMELVFNGTFGLFVRSGYFSHGDDKPSSSCEPTRVAFDRLLPNVADLAAAVREFGCEGELRVDILSVNGHARTYAWGHYGDKTRPLVLLSFRGGVLSEKLSERLP